MVGDFGWEHEGTKSGVGTVKTFKRDAVYLCESRGLQICKRSKFNVKKMWCNSSFLHLATFLYHFLVLEI